MCPNPSEHAFTARISIATARAEPGARCASSAHLKALGATPSAFLYACATLKSACYFTILTPPLLFACIYTAVTSSQNELLLQRSIHARIYNSCSSVQTWERLLYVRTLIILLWPLVRNPLCSIL